MGRWDSSRGNDVGLQAVCAGYEVCDFGGGGRMSDFESVRDGSLVGMAEFLRGQYGVADNLYVICRNRATGVMDVSKPRTAEEVQHTKLSELRAQKRIDRAKRERLRTQRERRWALRKTKGECLQVV